MTRRARVGTRGALAVALLAVLLAGAAAARAHAPLARDLLAGSGDAPLSVRLPGFGVVQRRAQGDALVFSCEALLGLGPGDAERPWLRTADGSTLLATARGLSRLDPDGCPAPASDDATLDATPIAALAAHPADPDRLYAVTAADPATLYASDDAGQHWQARASLPPGAPVDGLAVGDAEPPVVYLSRRDAGGAELWRASDGGDLVQTHSPWPLRLLSASRDGLWAVADDPATREALLLHRAPGLEDFEERARVRFFGGFARDADSRRVWLADEAGGLYRLEPDGAVFDEVSAEALSCLRFADGRLWACAATTVSQPAVRVSTDGGARFDPVLALDQVREQARCAPEAESEALCAGAWAEWRADVLGELPPAPAADPAPAAPQDAGTTAEGAPDPSDGDAGTHDDLGADAAPDPAPARAAGCALAPGSAGAHGPWLWLWLSLRRRRAR